MTLQSAELTGIARSEAAALGAAVLSETAAAIVLGGLAAADFTVQAYGDAFAEIQALWHRDGRIDGATVGALPSAEVVLRCAEFVPALSEAAVNGYVRQVADAAKVRRAQAIALSMATDGATADELLARCAELARVLGGSREAGWSSSAQGFADFTARQRGEPPRYIKCGVLPTFDRHTYLQPGDLMLIGARPSAGKTMVSCNLALGWARRGERVAYFSLETSPEKLWDRMIACEYGLDFSAVKRAEVESADLELFERSGTEFGRLPIWICQAAGRSVAWMRAQAARLGATIAIIDYVQLIRGKGDSRYEQVTQISIDLHEWAQADGVLVVGLCQLSRQGAETPKLSDLRESGQLEQDADLVLLLDKKTDPETGDVDYGFDIAKNKEGIVGHIPMVFDGAHQRVREMAQPTHAPAPARNEPVQQTFGGVRP